jgi:hypothetical protein
LISIPVVILSIVMLIVLSRRAKDSPGNKPGRR